VEFGLAGAAGAYTALAGSPAFGHMDLLTAMAHEMGHLLGFDHADSGLMAPALAPGQRFAPPAPGAPDQADSLSRGCFYGEELAGCPACQPAPASAAPAAPSRQVMLFDDAQGRFMRPGLQGKLATPPSLNFNLTPWDEAGASSGHGDDWVLAVRPYKPRS
jgi:hypothetical protein